MSKNGVKVLGMLALFITAEPVSAQLVTGQPNTLKEKYSWDPKADSSTLAASVQKYVNQAPRPELAPLERLPYFIEHLGASGQAIRTDAMQELGLAGVHHISRLPPDELDKLRQQIVSPRFREFRVALNTVIAGYLTAAGDKGLTLLDKTILKDSSTQFADRYATLEAIRMLWAKKQPPIPRERLVQSVRRLLEHSDIADLVVVDLERWEDWTVQDRMMEVVGESNPDARAFRRAVVRFLLRSVEKNKGPDERAAAIAKRSEAHLKALKQHYPQDYEAARKIFFPTAKPKKATATADKAEPVEREVGRVAPVAVGLAGIPVYTSAIHTIAFVPDGKTLLSGHGDGYVLSWDVAGGTHTRNLKAHSTWAFSIAFHPDGTSFATGSGDETVKLWNLDSKEPTKTLEHAEDDVHAVGFDTTGKHLFAAGDDMVVRIIDPTANKVIRTLKGHEKQIPCLAVSPTQPLIATGSRDDSIRLWNTESGEAGHVLDGHANDVHSVAFSPDGKLLASASYDETVKLWDVETGKLLRTMEGHDNWVFSVAFHPNGNFLASGDKDGRVLVWNVKTGTQLLAFKRQRHVSCVAFSPDGKQLASSSVNASICLWDFRKRKLLRVMQAQR